MVIQARHPFTYTDLVIGLPPRFLSKVAFPADLASDECWIWTGAHNSDGYGNFAYEGASTQAHRLAYKGLIGNIPTDLELDHLCRNRPCVNPGHLEPVTHTENVRRGNNYAKGWERSVTHCPNGHEYTPSNAVKQGRSDKRKCRTCHAIRQWNRRHPDDLKDFIPGRHPKC